MSVTGEETSEALSVPTLTQASSKTIFYISSVLILPVLIVFFYILRVGTNGSIGSWLKWDTLLVQLARKTFSAIKVYDYFSLGGEV